MGKAPAFQFYVKDWLSDPLLRQASFPSRGIWIDMLCYMWWSDTRGCLSGTVGGLSRMIGCSLEEMSKFLSEAIALKFASVTCNGDVTDVTNFVTVCNRRMEREEKDRENTRLRVAKHRSKPSCNGDVTLPSPVSPVSPVSPDSKTTPLIPPSGGNTDKEDALPEKPKPKRERRVKTGCPDEFPVTDQMREYAKGLNYHGDIDAMTDKFLRYHRAKGSVWASWYAAWQYWLRNDIERAEKDRVKQGEIEHHYITGEIRESASFPPPPAAASGRG